LTPRARQVISGHPAIGAEMLGEIRDLEPQIALMAMQHHERLDGSGYPKGLKADALLTESKILAVADVVEAMASHRPYRAALGIEAALAEIGAHRGTLFDADAVDACVRLFRDEGFQFEA